MEEISASQAAELLQNQSDSTILLDVREHKELEFAAIAGALHIPMGDIPARLEEIDSAKTVVCMCHGGGRSAQIAVFLAARGYEQVVNLAGGINAWSETVDSNIPRY